MGSDSLSGVRLAELIAALSLATDLGLGQPMEHILRECLLALRLGERLGSDEAERAVLYYVAPLAWVGCHADAYEQARWFGDDIAAKADVYGAALEAIADFTDLKSPFTLGHSRGVAELAANAVGTYLMWLHARGRNATRAGTSEGGTRWRQTTPRS